MVGVAVEVWGVADLAVATGEKVAVGVAVGNPVGPSLIVVVAVAVGAPVAVEAVVATMVAVMVAVMVGGHPMNNMIATYNSKTRQWVGGLPPRYHNDHVFLDRITEHHRSKKCRPAFHAHRCGNGVADELAATIRPCSNWTTGTGNSYCPSCQNAVYAKLFYKGDKRSGDKRSKVNKGVSR